jgi:hypothetical protein
VIKRPTVLVLGAGASAPFGFPSGRELRDKITTGLRKEVNQLFQLLVAAGFNAELITGFRDKLLRSGQPSVDVFLEHQPDFVAVGKTAIAASLTPLEDEDRLFGGKDNWYEYLFSKLGPSLLEDVAPSRLSVITFNYDRSLDHFLYTALRNSYDLSPEKAAKYVLVGTPIVHVYGELGGLPSLGGGPGVRSYQPAEPANAVDTAKLASKAIRIMYEGGRDDNLALGQAQKLVREAEVICFLGFGYLQENLTRLRLDQRTDGADVWGSAFGLGAGQMQPIQTFFGNHGNKSHIKLGKADQDVLEFLRQHPVFV